MSNGEVGDRLIRAAIEALRPIVRHLVASGVPFGQLEARVRELFVAIAEREFELPDRPQTDSRIALLTGINRKEVHRIRSVDPARSAPSTFSRNHATSLVSRWLTDPRATDRAGRPKPIPYQAARGPSFVKLAQQVSRDLPPRAILDELVRTGAAKLGDGNLVVLQADSYVPKSGDTEKLHMLAEDPPELIETMLRNIFTDGDEPLLQRKAAYDNLGADGATKLRAQVRAEGERFLRRMNRLLAAQDRDRNPNAPGGERRYAGVGLYYFEGKGATAAPPDGRPPTQRRGDKERRR